MKRDQTKQTRKEPSELDHHSDVRRNTEAEQAKTGKEPVPDVDQPPPIAANQRALCPHRLGSAATTRNGPNGTQCNGLPTVVVTGFS